MRHPKMATHQPAAPSGIPWSAEAERKLRSDIRMIWSSMWIALFAGLAAFAVAVCAGPKTLYVFGVLNLIGFIAQLYRLSGKRERLGEEMRRLPNGDFFEGSGMLANKPRSTAKLTEWAQWRPDSTAFLCTCRRLHQWTEAEWIPNLQVDDTVIGTQVEINDPLGAVIDPHGGRYVILCPCGLGHYKLKA